MTLLTKTIVGHSDHGRRMTLDEFDTAEGVEGRRYELSRGEVVVTDVPNPPHEEIVDTLRQQFSAYRAARAEVIQRILSGSECKILIEPTQSERHPDLAVYKTPPPARDSSVWSVWVPELVVEVVSPESAERDHGEKAEDYLLFGVREYWVVDHSRQTVTVNRRSRGRWQTQELRRGERYTTHVLPGFELVVDTILPATAARRGRKRR
jgi:Uma2 family endonuclease